MINTKLLKRNATTEKVYYVISNEDFEQKIQEAEEDIKNGNVYTLEEVMNVGLEVLQSRISELSLKEQIEAREFVNSWRNKFE